MFSTTLHFDWHKAPLSLNGGYNRWEKAKLTKDVRRIGFLYGNRMPKGLGQIEVQLVWVVKDNRKRDVDNIVATLKPLCDGLVDAGVVPDDVPRYMDKLMPKLVVDHTITQNHFELRIRQLA